MFTFLLESSDLTIERFVFSAWTGFIERSESLVTALLIVFVALTGYLVWTGRVQLGRGELVVRALQLALVFVIATKFDVLERFVYRASTDVPGAIASSMVASAGATTSDINETLDQIFMDGMKTGGKILAEASVYDVGTVAFGLVMIGVTLLALIPVALVLILAKLAVGVLLGLFPFAALLSLFPATRGLFDGYLRQVLSFALVPVMIYALLGLLLSMMQDVSSAVLEDALEGVPGLGVVAPYIVVMVLVGLLSTQVLNWSSGIAGALSLSAQGLFSRPAAVGVRSLEAVQAGRRAAAAAGASRTDQAAAFASGALRQGLGLRPPRTADPFFRSER